MVSQELELLRQLCKINLKEHHALDLQGLLWSIVEPLGLVAVTYVVFYPKFGSDPTSYILTLFVGISVMNFFAVSSASLGRTLVGNREIILNSTIPVDSLITSRISGMAAKLALRLLLWAVFAIALGQMRVSFLPLAMLLFLSCVCLTLGVCYVLAVFFCHAEDFGHIWGIIAQMIFFSSPIFYSFAGLPRGTALVLLALNPLSSILASFQEMLRGNWPALPIGIYAIVIGPAILLLGLNFYRRRHYSIIDLI